MNTSLIDALRAVQDAPTVVCLAGDRGAVLYWSDAAPEAARSTPISDASAPAQTPPEWLGSTWQLPQTSCVFVQADYEWPAVAMRRVPAPYFLRWDAAGDCTPVGAVPALPEPRPLARIALRSWTPLWSAADYTARCQELLRHIAAGDCYQGNLGVAIDGQCDDAPHRDVAAFIALIERSPAPFAALFRTPGMPSVVSHSPECLLSHHGRHVVSVPIKGTRRRVPGDEDAQRRALLASPKDGAELAMIVDLVRNDLSQICEPGSVRVAQPALLIDLPYVHHRAARITGVLRSTTRGDACMRALCPAGSITGAPKVMAMRLLHQLEGRPRGAWCGTFGWESAHGGDLAVAIRTASFNGNHLRTAAGSGVVADSIPAAEWDEVLAKCSAMRTAWS